MQAGIAEQPLAEICLECLLQHPKAGSACDIRSQRGTNAGFQVPAHGKDTAAQSGVARRTVSHRGSGRCQSLDFGGGRMHAMGQDGTPASQMESFIDCEIVSRPRKEPADLLDLACILVQVGLETHPGMFG